MATTPAETSFDVNPIWFLSAALTAIAIAIVVVGKPVWEELICEPRRKAAEASRAEQEVSFANAWQARKQQQLQQQLKPQVEKQPQQQVGQPPPPPPPSPPTPPTTPQQQQQPHLQKQEQKQERTPSHATVGRGAPSQASPADKSADEAGCWGCNAHGAGFKACSRCVQLGIGPPSRFCSADCLASAWPRHKEWHAAQQRERAARERAAIEQALVSAERSGDRISVPARRPPKVSSRKVSSEVSSEEARAAGGGVSAPHRPSAASDDDHAQLARAERQQAERERAQLAAAFTHLIDQLERDNADALAAAGGGALTAPRAQFGELVRQVDGLLDTQHTAAQVDALFAASAEEGRVRLRDFLEKPSTLDWFLRRLEDGSEGERGAPGGVRGREGRSHGGTAATPPPREGPGVQELD